MGYVRMIKAGGLHFVSNSIRFVPDLDDIPNFEQLTIEEEGGSLQNDTIGEAAKTLDEVVANLVKNFSDSTEYFQVRSFLFFWLLPLLLLWCFSPGKRNYTWGELRKLKHIGPLFSSWSTYLASSCTRISTHTWRISTSLSLPSPSITSSTWLQLRKKWTKTSTVELLSRTMDWPWVK